MSEKFIGRQTLDNLAGETVPLREQIFDGVNTYKFQLDLVVL